MNFVDECLLFDGDGGILYLSQIRDFLGQYMIVKHGKDIDEHENIKNMVRRNLSKFINENKKFKGVKRFEDTRGKNVRFKYLKLKLSYMK